LLLGWLGGYCASLASAKLSIKYDLTATAHHHWRLIWIDLACAEASQPQSPVQRRPHQANHHMAHKDF
jgi:hypothetical protein